MRRREFICLVASATTWPLGARAQQPKKPPIIGIIGVNTAADFRPFAEIAEKRLSELGWTVGHDVIVEYRNTETSVERTGEIAAEFARMQVNAITVFGDTEALTVKRAASKIPIVAVYIGDPVESGLAESLARPGGTVTGMALALGETAGKRLEFLRELVPGLKRVAIFGNSANPLVATERNAAIAAAHALGLDTIISGVRTTEDIAPTIKSLEGTADALYVCGDPLTVVESARVSAAALSARLPAMQLWRFITVAGGLISYGPDMPDMWRRAVELVDKILRGTKPADIPFEQPTKFELVINLKTAKALGLTIPDKLIALANDVVE
jgi:putative tryptophan/tyrosine transport system substrate-binding protein